MKDYEEMNVDYEELMLQVSDVMREANRLRPILSHEQAIKNIRGIVERHGKWVEDNTADYGWRCSVCGHTPWASRFCPNCGARMER